MLSKTEEETQIQAKIGGSLYDQGSKFGTH